jgi:PEP-CTERM motif
MKLKLRTMEHRRHVMLTPLRSSRRRIGLRWAGLLLALLAGQAVAGPIYDTSAVGELTGTRTEGAGLTTGGAYATDRSAFTLSWVITPLGGGTFHYQYTLAGFNTRPPGASTGPKSPNIGHILLDLSETCVAPGDAGCVTNVVYGGGPHLELGTFGPAPSHPGFPSGTSVGGVKFADTTGAAPFLVAFDSDRAPVYGDVYLKGGSASWVYNAGLVHHASSTVTDFIARPDGTRAAVPEPSTWLLLVTGCVGLLGYGWRHRQRAA